VLVLVWRRGGADGQLYVVCKKETPMDIGFMLGDTLDVSCPFRRWSTAGRSGAVYTVNGQLTK
jgi:hypothetical protein